MNIKVPKASSYKNIAKVFGQRYNHQQIVYSITMYTCTINSGSLDVVSWLYQSTTPGNQGEVYTIPLSQRGTCIQYKWQQSLPVATVQNSCTGETVVRQPFFVVKSVSSSFQLLEESHSVFQYVCWQVFGEAKEHGWWRDRSSHKKRTWSHHTSHYWEGTCTVWTEA